MSAHIPTRGEALGGQVLIEWIQEQLAILSQQLLDITSGVGNMRNEDNLSFLTDFALARDYLDVYSTTEVVTRITAAVDSVLALTSAVTSVNELIGDVILDATSVGADPAGTAAAVLVAAQSYADTIAAGFQPRAACRVATAAALDACTYANGTLGVGATLTATGNGALTIDTVLVDDDDRVVVKDQVLEEHDGIYDVTDKGSGGTPWVLTRATDADESAEVPAGMVTFITDGTAPRLAGTFVQLTPGPLTIGTDPQVFSQANASVSYTFSGGIVNTAGDIAPDYGTTAGTIAQGNDSRFTDARVPTAHKTSHQLAGTDELALATSQVVNLDSILDGKPDIANDLSEFTASAATVKTNLAFGDSADLDVGVIAGTVAAGDDARFGSGGPPSGTAGGALASTYPNPTLASSVLNTIAALTTTVLGTTRLTGTRSTFSDANYTVLATDVHVDQIGTLTAARTVTLPAASAVPAGWRVTIANQSTTTPEPPPGTVHTITIQRAGSDTLLNSLDFANTTSVVQRTPLGSMDFVSDGSSKWTIVAQGARGPFAFWQNTRKLAVPDGVWTPLPWNVLVNDYSNMSPGFQTLTTTIAVASNGATLPTATINVASTSGFPSSGYILITGPPGASTDTIVGYTGTTGTTFTGCNTTATTVRLNNISTGTLATGQTVTGANARFTFHTPYLYQVSAYAGWEANDTGIRNIRWRDADTLFVVTKGEDAPATNTAGQVVTFSLQPGIDLGQYSVVEVYQSSGGVLNTIVGGVDPGGGVDTLAYPLLMAAKLGDA